MKEAARAVICCLTEAKVSASDATRNGDPVETEKAVVELALIGLDCRKRPMKRL
ncbi:hypothetical protein [Spirosoma gilvum]